MIGKLPEKAKLMGKEWRMPCPLHGGTTTLSIRAEDGLYFCHAGCDQKELGKTLLQLGYILRRDARNGSPERVSEPYWWKSLWAGAVPSGRVSNYLSERGINLLPKELRWHYGRRAIVARVWLGYEVVGVHVTEIPSRRRRFHGEVRGGAIRLSFPELDRSKLMVGEGIESVLSLAQIEAWNGRIWAAGSSTCLGSVELPSGISSVIIAADFDGAGLVGAERLERRVIEKGMSCKICFPKKYGSDWNDSLREER